MSKPATPYRPGQLTLSAQQTMRMARMMPIRGRVLDTRVRLSMRGALQALSGGAVRTSTRWLDAVVAADRAQVEWALQQLAVAHTEVDIRFHWQISGTAPLHLHLLLQRVPGTQATVQGWLRDVSVPDSDMNDAHETDASRVLSQQRLQAVSRLTLLGEVASGLAHEINQPLAAIATFAQAGERMLGMPTPNVERVKQLCADVSQQALRAGAVIARMRSLVRRHGEQRERVDGQQLLSDFAALAKPMAAARHIELQVDMTNQASSALAVDVAVVQQVLMTLFQNAVDVSQGRDPARIILSMHAASDVVRFAVTDSGPGITEEVRAQLFKPFFSTKANGTGLGLVACRNLLQGYGSTLHFANQANGCCFWFELPRTT